nr:immunoglobulin heavy chain junction region [Macaca mulatta]
CVRDAGIAAAGFDYW